MAEIDSKAFDYMNEGDPDQSITGGAMEYSEYEMDMTPKQQERFLKKNAKLYKRMYDSDPLVDRKKISYKSYLENLDPELVSLRALDEEGSSENIAAKELWNLAKGHYGDIDRTRNMALGKGYRLY